MFYQAVTLIVSLLTIPAVAKVSLQKINISRSQTIKVVRPTVDTSNPLWHREARFNEIKPEHITAGLSDLQELVAGNMELAVTHNNRTFEEVYLPLEEIFVAINIVWSRYVGHYQRAVGGDQWQKLYQEVVPELVKLEQKVSQNKWVYNALNELASSGKLTTEQQRIIDLRLREAELKGIRLTGEQREWFNAIETELALLGSRFINNVRDSVAEFSIVLTDGNDTAGLPASFLQSAAANYRRITGNHAEVETGPWALTIDYPSYSEFMKHSDNRALREKLYRAYVNTASNQPYDNAPIIKEILELRKEQAQLLGFNNHAELSLASKMVENVEQVEQFLSQLQEAVYPAAKREQEEIITFANKSGAEMPLKHWDMYYWQHKKRVSELGITEEQLKRYFPLPKVLEGIFALAKEMFAIDIRPQDTQEIWHKDVSYYQIVDSYSVRPIGYLYLDPYSRPGQKANGAWLNSSITSRRVVDQTTTLPVATMVSNFQPPLEGQPALLTLVEIKTLFHEFGHALQALLTEVDRPEIAGIDGIEWDAVEIASMMMEEFLTVDRVIKSISRHIDTGEQLRDTLIKKINDSDGIKPYADLFNIVRSRLDLQLYSTFDLNDDPMALMRQLAEETQIYWLIDDDRQLNQFFHIFAGPYSAGYYSYTWSRMLSADIFTMFKEKGLDAKKLRQSAQRYRQTILAMGGSKPAAEVVKQLLDRPPSSEALHKKYADYAQRTP